MNHRPVAVLAAALAVVLVAPFPVAAQTGEDGLPMRTPDGQPDISGIFTFRTLTPLERPAALAGRETLGQRKRPRSRRPNERG